MINVRTVKDNLLGFKVLEVPTISFPAEEDKLYTVIIVDLDIEGSTSENFLHYAVNNVPGNDISAGDVYYEYLPPFVFDYNPTRDPAFDTETKLEHRMAILAFEQSDSIPPNTADQSEICASVFPRLQVSSTIQGLKLDTKISKPPSATQEIMNLQKMRWTVYSNQLFAKRRLILLYPEVFCFKDL